MNSSVSKANYIFHCMEFTVHFNIHMSYKSKSATAVLNILTLSFILFMNVSCTHQFLSSIFLYSVCFIPSLQNTSDYCFAC